MIRWILKTGCPKDDVTGKGPNCAVGHHGISQVSMLILLRRSMRSGLKILIFVEWFIFGNTIWLFNSSPWKIQRFLRMANHLTIYFDKWAIYTMAM